MTVRHKRRHRPTMQAVYGRSTAHKRMARAEPMISSGSAAPKLVNSAGRADWWNRHARKSPMRFCEALRFVKAVSRWDLDSRPLGVYPCRDSDEPGVAAEPQHWHAGHAA